MCNDKENQNSLICETQFKAVHQKLQPEYLNVSIDIITNINSALYANV